LCCYTTRACFTCITLIHGKSYTTMRTILGTLLLCTTASSGYVFQANSNPKAVHACVKNGSAVASCFGFDPTDSTDILQIAISSGASLLIVDNVKGQPWIVRPLHINASNIHVQLDVGVEIFAKQDEFHGADDSLVYDARFRQKYTLEDTIGSHACSLEVLARV
jgi:hypothetical protein